MYMNELLQSRNFWVFLSLGQSLFTLNTLRMLKKQEKDYANLYKITAYFAKIIEDNNVDLDEFDLIVLRDLGLVKVTH